MPKMTKKSRADILNNLLSDAVIDGELDLAEFAIERGATLHKTDPDTLFKSNLISGHADIQALLIDKAAKPTVESICFGSGLFLRGEVEESMLRALVPHVDWVHVESIIALLISVVLKPSPLLEDIKQHFDFKDCIVRNAFWIGRVFDYLRKGEAYPELLRLMDTLPVERFGFTHDADTECDIKRKLLKVRQYDVLAYLDKRKAFADGLHFDYRYSKHATEIAVMQDAGYSVTCEWDITVLTSEKVRMENLFNPLPDKQALLANQLRFMHDATPNREDTYHGAVNSLLAYYITKPARHIEPLMTLLLTLIDKGYMRNMSFAFNGLWGFSPDTIVDNDRAHFLHFLHATPCCWQYLFSNEVEIKGVDVDNLLSLALDFDAACKWLSEYAPDHTLFEQIEAILLSDKTSVEAKYRDDYLMLFKLWRWNVERQADVEGIKRTLWKALTAEADSFIEPWDDIGPSIKNKHQSELSGLMLVMIYVSPIDMIAAHIAPYAQESDWALVCDITAQSPMALLVFVPEGNPSRRHLLALVSNNT